ncbi:unnamed protein product [Adineta steineri]|uniref:Uncharacterized protein n=1 Tax=Adineta steineri TaxID=433720 RepID=A0A818XTZ3_9BILA|nr:unnamed protein product [Adineta steineri]
MHNVLILIVFYCLIHYSFASVRLENITVTRNENVKFRCQLPSNFSSQENILQWKKTHFNGDDLVISINGKIPKIFEKFYQTDLTTEYSSLELFHVDKDDSTTYICQTFETQTILCQYNLVVLIKPEAPLLTINKVNIEEYQAVTLTCSSSNGNPSPQYTWYRNGTLLTSLNEQVITTGNNSIYTFNVTRFDNQVKYECQIWNQALATPLRIEQYLHVKYRPYVNILEEITIFSSEQNQIRKIIGIENRQQNLTCQIDANPPPTAIYWMTNETTIVSREKILYIPRLTSEQHGIYTCIVENSIGKINHSIYLDVQYSPRVRTIESRIVTNRSDSIVIRCLSDSNPLPYQIVWFKNNTEILRQNHLTDLRFDHVERNDSGLYTCLVYNRFYNNQTSNGSSTTELIVQSRPIIETTYSKIASEIGQSLTLTCRVIGQPKPNIIWKHNDKLIQCDEIINDICYLRFSKILKNDFGIYICIAENLLGKEEWMYTIVSRGKPETPTDILVSEITSTSFKVQFSPSFDGGSGSQRFTIEVTDSSNSSIVTEQIPFNSYEYTIRGLNESTLYLFRIQSTNIYGGSPWSNDIPVQTNELIITSDDLPQLRVISYNSKENYLQFDYLPDTSRLFKLNENQLCLNIRQSSDGTLYQPTRECLPISNHRVQWILDKNYSNLKLSVCSKKRRNICGQEIEMKEEFNSGNSAPMIIGILTMTSFLILVIIVIGIICYRSRKRHLKSDMNKFGITGLDQGVKPVISEPRLQNPYMLYSNSNSHLSPYDSEYQQRNISNSFNYSCDIVDREQLKDEYGTTIRTATIHASPHWNLGATRSSSNPSSESSCATQNTNIVLVNGNEIQHLDPASTSISHYGFPPIMSPLQHQPSIIQSSSSSENSTPNRIKRLFYEVVV